MAYKQKSYRKFVASAATATLVASAVAPYASAATADQFTDVSSKYQDAVNFLLEKGATNGMSETLFGVNENIKRVDAAVQLVKVLGLDTENAPESGFTDVPARAVKEVNALKAAGITSGKSETTFDSNSLITRGELAVWIQRAFGLEGTADVTFTDVNKNYTAAVSALLTHKITNGISETQFGTTNNAKRGDFAIFLMRADAAKTPAVEEATVESVSTIDSTTLEVVLSGDVKEVAAEDFVFDNDLKVLKAEIKKAAETKETATKTTVVLTTSEQKAGTTYSLVSYKGEKPSTEIKVETPVTELAVKSVSANNLKVITVKFTEAVDKKEAENASYVKLLDGKTVVNATRTLSEDGKTLYIVAQDSFVQGKEYNLSIDGLKSVSGEDVTKYNETIKTLDTVVPVAESATLTSPKTLELQFSEPVVFPTNPGVLTDKVQIDGINVYASDIDVSELYSNGKVVITLGTAVSVGDHKVKVANLNDHAGFPMATKEFTVSLEKDEVAPEITAVEVLSNQKIQVTFSETVDHSSVVASNFVVKVPGKEDNYVTSVTKKSGTVYEMNLTSALDVASVVESKLSYKGIKDNYGNTVKEAKEFNFVVKDDVNAPTIVDHVVTNANEVEVTFSKSVKNVDASDFQLLDKDGKVVSGGISSVTGKVTEGKTSDTTYVLTLADALNKSGKYTVKVVKENNIVDLSIRGNKLSETAFDITLNDKKAPSILSAKYDVESEGHVIIDDADNYDSKITLTFSEAMDTTSITNKANYILGDMPLSEISGISISAPNNKTVVITYNKSKGDLETFGNLKVLAVKDLAGNILTAGQLSKTLTEMGIHEKYNSTVALETAVTTNNVQLIAKNKVKVTANEGYFFSSVDPNKVTIVAGDKLEAQVAAVQISEDKKSIELTLNKNLSGDAKADGETLQLKADADAFGFEGEVKTLEGKATLLDKVKASVVIPESGKLQVIDGVGYPNNKIIITFDEAVKITDVNGIKNGLVLKDADGDRLAPYCYDVANDGTNLTITFHQFVADYTEAWTVSLTDNLWLKDTAGNNVNDFSSLVTEVLTVEGPQK